MEGASEYISWKNWTADSFGMCDSVNARYFQLELSRSGMDPQSQLSLVELGFGNGTFAGWARARGWRYCGIEADDELVRRATEAGLEAHPARETGAVFSGRSGLDLVIAFDVFEHLEVDALVALLMQARDALRPGGHVVFRVPSGDSPFSRAIQHGDLTHRSILGTGAIQQIAQKASLEVCQIREPVMPLRGIGLRRLVRRFPIWLGRKIIARILRVLYYDNRPCVIAPNMLVVLRRS
jgi:SAM-dependent methyltransferase